MPLALIWRALVAILIVAISPYVWAQPLQPVPALVAHAIDRTGTLTATELQVLDERLARFEQEKGTQIVVLLVPTTAPEDIAAYANRVANTWKIGRQNVGDGLLLVVAKNDRKLRIEVAKTLEGAVPDLAARQIMDDAITPRFKQNDYAGGLTAGVEQLFARIRGESLPAPASGDKATDGFDWVDLGIFFFIIVPVGTSIARALLGRVAGSLLMGAATGIIAYLVTASILVALGAALLAMVWGAPSRGNSRGGGLLGGTGWSSGSSSGSSGGGFSSGGGGDFGGGGASGDW